MKRIVDGVTYNTETSTKIAAKRTDNDHFGEHADGTLYVTRGGAFFEHWYDDDTERHSFDALSRDQAQEWILEGDVELFDENAFGVPPEGGDEHAAKPEATMYVRVPESLKRRIDSQARAAGQSVNAWAMRCMESCIEAQREEPGEPAQ